MKKRFSSIFNKDEQEQEAQSNDTHQQQPLSGGFSSPTDAAMYAHDVDAVRLTLSSACPNLYHTGAITATGHDRKLEGTFRWFRSTSGPDARFDAVGVTTTNVYTPSVDDIGACVSCQWVPTRGLPSSFAEIGPLSADPSSLSTARALLRGGSAAFEGVIARYAPPPAAAAHEEGGEPGSMSRSSGSRGSAHGHLAHSLSSGSSGGGGGGSRSGHGDGSALPVGAAYRFTLTPETLTAVPARPPSPSQGGDEGCEVFMCANLLLSAASEGPLASFYDAGTGQGFTVRLPSPLRRDLVVLLTRELAAAERRRQMELLGEDGPAADAGAGTESQPVASIAAAAAVDAEDSDSDSAFDAALAAATGGDSGANSPREATAPREAAAGSAMAVPAGLSGPPSLSGPTGLSLTLSPSPSHDVLSLTSGLPSAHAASSRGFGHGHAYGRGNGRPPARLLLPPGAPPTAATAGPTPDAAAAAAAAGSAGTSSAVSPAAGVAVGARLARSARTEHALRMSLGAARADAAAARVEAEAARAEAEAVRAEMAALRSGASLPSAPSAGAEQGAAEPAWLQGLLPHLASVEAAARAATAAAAAVSSELAAGAEARSAADQAAAAAAEAAAAAQEAAVAAAAGKGSEAKDNKAGPEEGRAFEGGEALSDSAETTEPTDSSPVSPPLDGSPATESPAESPAPPSHPSPTALVTAAAETRAASSVSRAAASVSRAAAAEARAAAAEARAAAAEARATAAEAELAGARAAAAAAEAAAAAAEARMKVLLLGTPASDTAPAAATTDSETVLAHSAAAVAEAARAAADARADARIAAAAEEAAAAAALEISKAHDEAVAARAAAAAAEAARAAAASAAASTAFALADAEAGLASAKAAAAELAARPAPEELDRAVAERNFYRSKAESLAQLVERQQQHRGGEAASEDTGGDVMSRRVTELTEELARVNESLRAYKQAYEQQQQQQAAQHHADELSGAATGASDAATATGTATGTGTAAPAASGSRFGFRSRTKAMFKGVFRLPSALSHGSGSGAADATAGVGGTLSSAGTVSSGSHKQNHDLMVLANTLMEDLQDKDTTLRHMRQCNKILGARVRELELREQRARGESGATSPTPSSSQN